MEMVKWSEAGKFRPIMRQVVPFAQGDSFNHEPLQLVVEGHKFGRRLRHEAGKDQINFSYQANLSAQLQTVQWSER